MNPLSGPASGEIAPICTSSPRSSLQFFQPCCAAPPSSLSGVADQLGLSNAAFRSRKTGGGRGRKWRRRGSRAAALRVSSFRAQRVDGDLESPTQQFMREGWSSTSAVRAQGTTIDWKDCSATTENFTIRIVAPEMFIL